MKLEDVSEFVQAISPYWDLIEKEIMYEREHNYPSILGVKMMIKAYSFMELEVGDFFLDIRTNKYGIKLSPARYFDLKYKHVYGFFEGRVNDSPEKNYIKCDYEVKQRDV